MLARLLKFLMSPWKRVQNTPTPQEQVSDYDRYDLFLPEQQYIYHYFDGKDVVHADPMILYRKIMDVAPDLSVDMKLARSASKDASLGHVGTVKKVRSIFNIKSMDDGGLTEIATVQLLNHFLVYCELLKKSTSPLPTLQMETSSPSVPCSEGSQPMPSTPDSGSTAKESSTAEPQPSPTVSG